MLNIVNYIFVLFLNCINLPVPQLSKSSIMSNQALFGSLRKVLKYYFEYFTLLTKPQIVLADKSEGWNFRMKSKPRNTDLTLRENFLYKTLSSSFCLPLLFCTYRPDNSFRIARDLLLEKL